MKTNYKKKFSKLFIISVLITSFLVSSNENSYAGAWVANGRLYSFNYQTAHSGSINMYNGLVTTFGCEGKTARSRYISPGGYWNLSFTAYAEKCSSIMY